MESSVVYKNEIVRRHPLALEGGLTQLNEVCARDYKGQRCFDERIECLDLDACERRGGGNPKATMDVAIGICNWMDNRTSGDRLMLVELRLGYKNVDNLSGASLKEKSVHSRELLGGQVRTDQRDYFVFGDGLASQAKRTVNQLAIAYACRDKWIAMGVSEFNRTVLSVADKPYVPENAAEKIRNVLEAAAARSADALLEELEKWLDRARDYKNKYFNLEETAHICTVVPDVMTGVCMSRKEDGDIQEIWGLYEEDFQGLKDSVSAGS